MTRDFSRIVSTKDPIGLIAALALQEVLGIEDVLLIEPFELSERIIEVHATDAVILLSQATHQLDEVLAKAPVAKQHMNMVAAHPELALSLDDSATQHYIDFLLDQLRSHSLKEVCGLTPVQERATRQRQLQQAYLSNEEVEHHGNVLVARIPCAMPLLSRQLQREVLQTTILMQKVGARMLYLLERDDVGPDLGALARQFGGEGTERAAWCTGTEEILDLLLVQINDPGRRLEE